MSETGQIATRGTHPRSHFYNETSKHFTTALNTLVDLCLNAKQESVRVSAASKLMDKIIPNLASTNLTDDEGKNIPISLLNGITVHVSSNDSAQEAIKVE